MLYTVYFTHNGAPKTGLSPTIDIFVKLSDGTSAGSPPSVTELSGGAYKFDYTPTEEVFLRVDSNDATMDDAERYKPMRVSLADTGVESTFNGVGYVDGNAPATQAAVDRNAFLIESQRGEHTWQGNYFYVDPVNGASHASGARGGRSDPYASVQDCHDNAITDSNHDVIFLVSGDPSAITTLTEDVALTKRYFFIRGPGRDFLWTRSGNGDTISADGADGLELSGFQLETAGTGAGHGVKITDSDFVLVHNVWINETQGDGINILRGNNCIICSNHFQGTGQTGAGQGVHIIGTAGTSNHNSIFDNVFSDVQGDAIRIEQGTTHHTHIFRNQIHTSTGWGINIGGSSVDAIVHDNILYDNASGNIKDDGTRTGLVNNEQWAKDSGVNVTEWEGTAVETPDTAGVPHVNVEYIDNIHGAAVSLKSLTDIIITSGTAQGAGVDNNRIQLAASASSISGTYDPALIFIADGTGIGQSRRIMQYDGPTRMATVNRSWKVPPDNTSEYVILAEPGGLHTNEGDVMGAGPSTITLNDLAKDVDNFYVDQCVIISSGPGEDQSRIGTAYDGDTHILTINRPWDTQPDDTSCYIMSPHCTNNISITAILGDTGTTIPAQIDGVETKVDAVLVDTGTTLPAGQATILAQLVAMAGDGFATALHSLVKIIQTVTALCGPGAGQSSACDGADLPLLCELWKPDVTGEDTGGGGVETFTVASVSASCQLQGASGGETLTPQELAVGSWKFTAGDSLGIDERWQIRNVRDENGFAVAGLEDETLEIVTPPVALTEMGLVTMTVRLAR